tara:strand:- start:125 stop:382 length:258 start_codon:yes stop_codon:yes gene_type:complete
MAKISTYATSTPALTDKLIGSDADGTPTDATKNFTVESILTFANANAVPGTTGATGTKGMIAVDATHLYICVATDTWRRVAISTW